jgi:undecaprenyl-diphosphatase
VDWRIYHAINNFVVHHSWLGSLFKFVESYGTYLIGIAAVALWLLSRPGGDRKWKLVAGSALASAALALIVNKVISSAWHRDRPYQTHDVARIWGARKSDPSFPSDHASASFGIAVAVLLIDSVAGLLFLTLAILIAVGRVVVGEHYPGDVLAGVVIGTVCGYGVVTFARPAVALLVRIFERVTDPALQLFWRRRGGLAP